MTDKPTYANDMKGKTGIHRIINAFGYSVDGLKAAYRMEAAFRQVVWLNGVLVILIACLPFAMSVKMILLLASALSLIVELFNTGLEAVVDRIGSEYHPLSKVGKDVGSAAQLITLTLLFVLWAMAIYTTFIAAPF
jgi:diacylglycerol kinase (ATP)